MSILNFQQKFFQFISLLFFSTKNTIISLSLFFSRIISLYLYLKFYRFVERIKSLIWFDDSEESKPVNLKERKYFN